KFQDLSILHRPSHLRPHGLPHIQLNHHRLAEPFLAEEKSPLPEVPIYEGMLRSPPGTFSLTSGRDWQSTLLTSVLPLRGSFHRLASSTLKRRCVPAVYIGRLNELYNLIFHPLYRRRFRIGIK